jgi:hypothetical protein
MLNITAHANERDYSYVTCGAFLPVILERMARSWWNLFYKYWFSLPVFGISNFPRPPHISFHALLTKLQSCSSRAFYINYLNFHIYICYLCCRAEYVSQGVLQIIREAPNGSIWVSEEDKPSYQVIIPSRQTLRAEWIIFGKGCLLTRRILENWAFLWLPIDGTTKRTQKALVYNYNRPFT